MLKHTTIYACHNINQPVMFIGDVHGQYTALNKALTNHWGEHYTLEADWTLIAALEESDIDPDIYLLPTLVFLGDIIDRGEESATMLKAAADHVSCPNIHFIWGNHEEMMYRALGGELEYEQAWFNNGGIWYSKLSAKERRLAERNLERLYDHSFDALTIELAGDPLLRFGAVHGECPVKDWDEFISSRKYRNQALWGRDNIKDASGIVQVENVHTIYAGHTPKPKHYAVGNQRWINRKGGIGLSEVRADKMPGDSSRTRILTNDLFQPREPKGGE